MAFEVYFGVDIYKLGMVYDYYETALLLMPFIKLVNSSRFGGSRGLFRSLSENNMYLCNKYVFMKKIISALYTFSP